MPYNQRAIRELLLAAFDDSEFSVFCSDYAPAVKQKFTEGQTRPQRVVLLIDHAQRHGLMDKILLQVKGANPFQYSAYEELLTKAEIDTEEPPMAVLQLPLPLQKYDIFFEQWVRELSRLDMTENHYARSVISSVAIGPTHLNSRVRQRFAELWPIAALSRGTYHPIRHGDVWCEH
jgi:hypothetical protein